LISPSFHCRPKTQETSEPPSHPHLPISVILALPPNFSRLQACLLIGLDYRHLCSCSHPPTPALDKAKESLKTYPDFPSNPHCPALLLFSFCLFQHPCCSLSTVGLPILEPLLSTPVPGPLEPLLE
jgi:hypothetical protein